MKINNVNEQFFKKKSFTLRKIAVGFVLASTLILTGCGKENNVEDIKNNIEETTLDYNEKGIMESLENYVTAYETYEKNKENVELRVDLVKETKNLSKIANQLIETKINDALDTNYDITIKTDRSDGNRILMADGEPMTCSLPSNFNEIANKKDFIDSEIYKGDGSNSAWDKEIDGFNKKGLSLYKEIVKNLTPDYIAKDETHLQVVSDEENTKGK